MTKRSLEEEDKSSEISLEEFETDDVRMADAEELWTRFMEGESGVSRQKAMQTLKTRYKHYKDQGFWPIGSQSEVCCTPPSGD